MPKEKQLTLQDLIDAAKDRGITSFEHVVLQTPDAEDIVGVVFEPSYDGFYAYLSDAE